VPLVQAAFLGIKAAVVVIVAQALWRLSQKALSGALAGALAGAAFVALFVFAVPFPLVIAAAAATGTIFMAKPAAEAPGPHPAPVPLAGTLRTAALWSGLWALPLGAALWADPAFLGALGMFFSQLAVVTFGGAYAVLAYMTQAVVSEYGWLSTGQMIDALGLAETTPGPLILVTQFVAMLAGQAAGGVGLALLAGALALWVTFVPCFLWIFVAAPYVEALTHRPRLSGALSAITAAVVGVIAQLGLWFALHVGFADLERWGAVPVPVLSSIDPAAFALMALAAALLLWAQRSVPAALLVLALAGIALGALS
jgi:chromate transporter